MSHFEFSHGGTPACVPPAMADAVGSTRMATHGRAPALLRRSGYAKAQRHACATTIALAHAVGDGAQAGNEVKLDIG